MQMSLEQEAAIYQGSKRPRGLEESKRLRGLEAKIEKDVGFTFGDRQTPRERVGIPPRKCHPSRNYEAWIATYCPLQCIR